VLVIQSIKLKEMGHEEIIKGHEGDKREQTGIPK
jgi:hypothetical protein